MRISDWSSDVCSSDLVPVIVSERNNPAMQEVGPNWNRLRSLFYPRAHGLVVMTSGALSFFPESHRRRSWVIPNFATLPDGVVARRDGKVLTAVGRMVHQKGFDLLLQRSEEHTSELQSLMRISYAVFCLKKKNYSTQR